MECEEASRLLGPLFDGELSLERSLEVEAHLEKCRQCDDEYVKLHELHSILVEKLPYEMAPERLRSRLRSRPASRATMPGALTTPKSSRVRVSWPMLAVATSILVFAAIIYLRPQPVPRIVAVDPIAEEVLSGHLRSLMGNHLADVLSSDQHTVKPFFAGKLDFSPPVVDLARAGFALAAGRLDYLDGHPVAALVYRRNRHIINLFVWPSGPPGQAQPVRDSRRGYQIVHWTSGGMTEWAVSDLNAKELTEFADDLQHPPK